MTDPLAIVRDAFTPDNTANEGGAANRVVYPPKRTNKQPHTTTKNTRPVGMGAGRPRLKRGITAAAIEKRNRWRANRRFA